MHTKQIAFFFFSIVFEHQKLKWNHAAKRINYFCCNCARYPTGNNYLRSSVGREKSEQDSFEYSFGQYSKSIR